MTKRMLIDSTNAEETRVVVLDGNRLEEFDLETSTKHQLKGNIYLAKVVRVEPSLQAAFVEYGGNRHGFLAFGEIHPDYYQIPVADRKRLLEAQEQEAREDEEAEEQAAAAQDRGRANRAARPIEEAAPVETMEASGSDVDPTLSAASNDHPADVETDAEPIEMIAYDAGADDQGAADEGIDPVPPEDRMVVAQPATIVADLMIAPEEASMLFPEEPGDMFGAAEGAATDEAERGVETEPSSGEPAELFATEPAEQFGEPAQEFSSESTEELAGETTEELAGEASEELAGEAPEQFGGENDTEEPDRRSTPRFLRHYKIQEVIRRRQVLLIQVVKEERGSKGAALTTYMSLAGRFSVLMPNSPRGGGISRKITSASDRRRLKEVTAELDLPRGMGLIVRTAGANRPKPEILRDCEYLLNQWDQIRELTMKSMAPALIYEEASLIKRAIRDVYSRDVDDILVDGEQGWRAARDFMRMLMPTHAKKVQLWKEPQPLFAKAQVEQQLEGMLQPTVQLRSGGYLVINQTEALVAIDVNSGRSTRERGIEETALKTNLEAAEEAARQLRLRDLAGLIVIDFIDMESRRNVAAVERKLKDALKHDRARIQVGGISHFGLLEMSRQRLRPSLAEANFVTCTHCGGTGHMRSTESAALVTLRAIEDEGGRRRAAEIMVHCASSIALYILNHKRQRLTDIEVRYSMIVAFVADETLRPPELRIEKVRAQTAMDTPAPVSQLAPPEPFEDPDEIEMNADMEESDDGIAEEASDEADAGTDAGTGDEARSAAGGADGEGADSAEKRSRRRRRRRGGRREEGAVASVSADGSGDGSGDSAGDFGTDEAGDDASEVAEAAGTDDVSGNGDAVGDEAGSDAVAASAAAESGAAPSADAEEGERRRRGRRGGRRRRRDGSEAEGVAPAAGSDDVGFVEPAPVSVTPAYTPPPYSPPAYVPPAYEGPTPANPFGGASAFDIFDAIEQAEEQRLTQRKPMAASVAVPEPEPVPETAAALAPELVSMAPEAEPVAQPASELMAQTAESVAEAAPMAVAPVPEVSPEPEVGPTSAPLIQPMLIGGEAEPVEKKRGWWRR